MKKTADNATKSRRKNNKAIKTIISLVVLVVVFGYFFASFIRLLQNPASTVVIKQGQISQEEIASGYIIRDETVVKGENYKNGMEQIVDEGSKVAKDESIYRYYSNGEKDLKQKILMIDLKIQKAIENNTDQLFSTDTKLLDTQISQELKKVNLLNNIQKIKEEKNNLNAFITRKAKISGDLSPKGSYLKKLVDERNEYESRLNKETEYVKSSRSGIVSYRVDGLEETLNTNDITKYNKEFLEGLNLKTGQVIPISTEQGKIVNNFICYIAFTSSSKQAKEAKVGNNVQIILPGSKKVDAKIENIIEEKNDEKTIILSFREEINNILSYRKISFEVIWWNQEGYKVPNSAIITDGNYDYIIRSKAGYLKRILIKVKKKTDTYSIISKYSASELEEMGIKMDVATSFSLYDEIVVNPTENQIESSK